MLFIYPANLSPDEDGGFVVTFRYTRSHSQLRPNTVHLASRARWDRPPACLLHADVFRLAPQVNSIELRPVLRPMKYPRDFNRFFLHPIHRDIGQGRKRQFAPSAHPTAGPSHIGKILQPGATVINHIGNSPGGFRVVLFDSRANTFEIFHCWQRPPNFHQDFKKRRSRSPTCSCVRNSPRSKAASPRFTASANRSSSSK